MNYQNSHFKTKILYVLTYFIFISTIYSTAHAQTKQHVAKNLDNYTIQRLIILNDKEEVLMEKNAMGWMTPGIRSNQKLSIKEALEKMASDLGIIIEKIKLSGVITYKFNETPQNPEHAAISFRTHYTAKYKAGEIIQPNDPSKQYKWVSINEAPQLINIDALRAVTMQILKKPKIIWGGSFLINLVDGKFNSSKMIEEFHPLFETENPEINSPLIQLTITNDKNEILMRKTQYGWMTPAQRFYSKQNMHEVINTMVAAYGITIETPTLAGLFTYKYQFKNVADTRHHYLIKYKAGNLISPPNEEVMWMPKDEAIEKLTSTVASLGQQTAQVLNHPNQLWGGSFILDRVDGKLQSTVEEAFYSLR